jgi:hypothetical protein
MTGAKVQKILTKKITNNFKKICTFAKINITKCTKI